MIIKKKLFIKEILFFVLVYFPLGIMKTVKRILIPFLVTIALKSLTAKISNMAHTWIISSIVTTFRYLMSIIYGIKSLFVKNPWNWYYQETPPYYGISSIENSHHPQKFHFFPHHSQNAHFNCPCHHHNKHHHKIFFYPINRWRWKKFSNV